MRVHAHTHTHTHTHDSKGQITNTVKKCYEVMESKQWCWWSQVREAETSLSISVMFKEDETNVYAWLYVSWDQVTREPNGYRDFDFKWSCVNLGVQRSLKGFAFSNKRNSDYKRTFLLRLIPMTKISSSGLRISMDRKGRSIQSQALFSLNLALFVLAFKQYIKNC